MYEHKYQKYEHELSCLLSKNNNRNYVITCTSGFTDMSWIM